MNEPTIINPFPTITFGEIIDIIVLAILLYTSIVWAQRTRAAFVVRGIVILGIVYIIARYLDLQMTAWIFQAFFAVFLIVIVVIFKKSSGTYLKGSRFGVCLPRECPLWVQPP
jgi:DNA integrity scanning protein DisA with diadenylate cyclase activity